MRSLLTLAAAMALLAPAAGASEHQTLRGSDVRIWNLAGAVTLEPARGDAVEVEIDRSGADAGALRIVSGPIDGAQTLRVLHPNADRIVYRRAGAGWNSTSTLTVLPDGRFNLGKGWNGHRVTVASGGRGREAHADLRIAVPAGQRLRVYVGVGEMTAENVDGEIVLDISSGQVSSAGGSGDLVVDTGSGAVDVRDHSGALSVDTGSGAVDVSRVRGARVHVDTGSGAVRGENLRADQVDVDTGSGEVALRGVDAPRVSVDTGSGGVSLELLHASPSVTVDTGSGGVRLRVPNTLSARLDLDASAGRVTCSLPMTVTHKESGELRGDVGGGAGRIHVDTGAGAISIDPLNGSR